MYLSHLLPHYPLVYLFSTLPVLFSWPTLKICETKLHNALDSAEQMHLNCREA